MATVNCPLQPLLFFFKDFWLVLLSSSYSDPLRDISFPSQIERGVNSDQDPKYIIGLVV